MPNGKVHATATVITAAVSTPILLTLTTPPHALSWAGGCLCGLILTPDLDLERPTKSHAIVRHSAGRGWMLVWFLFWYPYARLLPHRSPWSHAPVIGTLLRVAYLALLPMLGMFLWHREPYLPHLSPAVLWALGGLMCVDALHALMDWVF
ncbi:MAG: hypothetical protein D6755_06230 [Anaerolineae bacterium]|nr:MAG: hypothetical protein D6755_06230 [Anaerolineae bacterium]